MAVPFPFEIPWGYKWQFNLQVLDHEGTKWSTMKDLSGQPWRTWVVKLIKMMSLELIPMTKGEWIITRSQGLQDTA